MRYIAKTLLMIGLSIVSIGSIETRYAKGYDAEHLNSKWALQWNQCLNYNGYPYYSVYNRTKQGVSCAYSIGGGLVRVLTNGMWWEGQWYGKGGIISTGSGGIICYSEYWKNSKPGFCGLRLDIQIYGHYYKTNL